MKVYYTRFYWYGLVAVVVVCLLYGVQLTKANRMLIERNTSLGLENNNLMRMTLLHSRYSKVNLISSYKLTDLHNNVIRWEEIPFREKLIFRFNESNCIECIRAQIPYLNGLSKRLGEERIILLVSYSTRREMIATLKALNLEYRTYNISDVEFAKCNSDIEALNIPYFFYVDAAGESRDLFFPLKEIPKVSSLYFDQVSK